MTTAQKRVPRTDKPSPQTIALDDEDRAFILPLVKQMSDGKKAEALIAAYLNSIKRRSGVTGNPKIVIDKECRQMVVLPGEQ